MLELSDATEVRPEDRLALRRAVRFEAQIFPEGSKSPMEGVVTDLSVHGLWVAVQHPIDLGADLVVSFRPSPRALTVSLDAMVARVDESGADGELGMGLSFVALSAEDQIVVEDALAGLPARVPAEADPVIADIVHDPLEDEVEQLIDDEDLCLLEESGVRAIVVHDDDPLARDDFEPLRDSELELFAIG